MLHGAFWTSPGEITLTVVFHTEITPAPKGAKGTGFDDGYGMVKIKAAPVKLEVVE